MRPETSRLNIALASGYERMAAWADLLDQINVFPIADDDTGRNLRISLAPLRLSEPNRPRIVKRLREAATGNSGNIAAGFFSGFLAADPETDFTAAVRLGREKAWAAVADPRPGTMLTAFDVLAENDPQSATRLPELETEPVLDALRRAVWSTAETLPALKQAGVVDAGALGVFLFFEGFFARASGTVDRIVPPTEAFHGRLKIADHFSAGPTPRYCVDTTIRTADTGSDQQQALAGIGESLVVLPGEGEIKIHLHTDRRREVRRRLESIGKVVRWSDEIIEAEADRTVARPGAGSVHVMTDAAGSVTREEAKRLGMTLLDSYIVFEEKTVPETLVAPARLYEAMRNGQKVTTAQASVFERQQCYQSVLSRHRWVLYLCVGSVFTGNYRIAADWKHDHDLEDRFTVIDTGTAAGRLAVAAVATARRAAAGESREAVLAYSRRAVAAAQGYVFLDRLKYLAAGGRLSKTKGFFGDLLGKKPIIRPTAEGAVRAGIVGDKEEQLGFALDRLETEFGGNTDGSVLIEYSDNRRWVTETVLPAITERFPRAQIHVTPLSLTSGAHMGPGTWGMAFLAVLPTLPRPVPEAQDDTG
jgi:DegV family protein with EDD domain